MNENSKKRKTLTSAIAVILAVLIAIGGSTFAYLQANTDDVVNEFATNQVTVDLKESTDGKYNIVPGTSEFKDPTVTVNATVPAYVYVEVTDNTENLVTYAIANGWLKLNGYDNVYYREIDSAANNEKFEVLKNNTVSYDAAIVNSDMLVQNDDGTYSLKNGITLSFNASAIQKEPFANAADAYEHLVNGDQYLSYKEIAAMAFENSPALNRGADYFESMSKHTSSKTSVNSKTYFAVPITPQKQINIVNNSSTQSLSVYMLHKTDLSVVTKVEPRLDYTIPLTTPYLAISVSNNDGSDIKPEDVDLGNFIISYTDSDDNILDEMKTMAYDYAHTHLKNFDADAIRILNDNSSWCAHAGGTQVAKDKNTERAIISAIDRGAAVIEIDIRKTSDDVLVCEHNENVTGTTTTVAKNTYADCLAAKADLLTFEQALNIIKEHSDTILLNADVKTADCYDSFYEIIDKYDFAGRLDHSLVTAEHYGADAEARSKRGVLCLDNHPESGFYNHYVTFAKECVSGEKTGISMWDATPAYNSTKYSIRTAFALYFVTANAGDKAFYRRNLYDNVYIPLPADDKTMEQNIIDMMPHKFWSTSGSVDVA